MSVSWDNTFQTIGFQDALFQSQTGSPCRYDCRRCATWSRPGVVSIPNGLPRPFSNMRQELHDLDILVSIPDGKPLPLRQETNDQIAYKNILFQSRTGCPGHLA